MSNSTAIIKNLVPKDRYYLKCPYPMEAEFYVVHNTANDAPAANEIAYMVRNDFETSFHYAIDDKYVVQGIPEDRNGWHAGDGGDGDGNRKGIGIEICYSLSGGSKFIAAEKLAAKFLAEKLKERGWGIDKVKKHQDFDGKYCPHRTLDMGWQRFLDMIQAELDKGKVLHRVQVGAFSKKSNAENMLVRVKRAGFQAFVVKVGDLYKVQVGAFSKRVNALLMWAKVKAKGFDAFITKESGEAVAVAVNDIKEGSVVRVKNGAKTYSGGDLASFVYNRDHVVKEVKGDRAVITYGGVVVAAVKVSDLTLI